MLFNQSSSDMVYSELFFLLSFLLDSVKGMGGVCGVVCVGGDNGVVGVHAHRGSSP